MPWTYTFHRQAMLNRTTRILKPIASRTRFHGETIKMLWLQRSCYDLKRSQRFHAKTRPLQWLKTKCYDLTLPLVCWNIFHETSQDHPVLAASSTNPSHLQQEPHVQMADFAIQYLSIFPLYKSKTPSLESSPTSLEIITIQIYKTPNMITEYPNPLINSRFSSSLSGR